MQNDDWEQGLICPSFNSYSSDKQADVAAKVCREFDHLKLLDESNKEDDRNENIDGDDDFEFVPFQKSVDQVFFDDNQIGPVFPVFNRDLLFDKSQRDLTPAKADEDEDDEGSIAALPSSSSSSEVDELEAVPPGTYCVWMQKLTAQDAAAKCKIKSKSTGTSSTRRWRLKDLLHRCNSEGGKDSFVFLTPLSSSSKKGEDNKKVEHEKEKVVDKRSGCGSGSGGLKPKVGNKGQNAVAMAHEAFYGRNKAVAKDDYNKRRSYLPYRQDLVGFFASANAMSRTFPAL